MVGNIRLLESNPSHLTRYHRALKVILPEVFFNYRFFLYIQFKKICIQDTLYLLICPDRSTVSKMDRQKKSARGHISGVTCHMSCVACHLYPVICHLLLTPTVTATYLPPTNSPTMHSRPVCKDTKT